MPNAAEDKAAFFERLYALNDISDDDEQHGVVVPRDPRDFSRLLEETAPSTVLVSASSSFTVPDAPNSIISGSRKRTPELRRTLTDPAVSTGCIKETPLLHRQARLHSTKISTPLATEVSFVEDTPLAQRHEQGRPEQRRTVSAPVPSAKPVAPFQANAVTKSQLGKRKRTKSLQLKPENERIFSGLTFFYIPNDDKSPLRKARMTKAQEYGVTWTTVWSPLVTHIIVDKVITYRDVISFLKISKIPDGTVMVNDEYPVHCWQYGCILDANQPQYLVAGSQVTSVENKVVEGSQASGTSLQVKPKQSKPGKWDYVPPRGTPPRSEAPSPAKLSRSSTRQTGESSRGLGSASAPNPESQLEISDDLDAAIKEVRKSGALQLDDDDCDDRFRPPCQDTTISSSSELDSTVSMSSFGKPGCENKGTRGQEFFSCMKGGTGRLHSDSPNANTIAKLEEMAEIYTIIKDEWRSISYRKAISVLKRQTKRVCEYEQAAALPGVGERLAKKIVEIAATNDLRCLDNARQNPRNQILQRFMNIYGVGLSQASKWLAAGYTTLEDLKSKAELTENQIIGIEHYNDLLTRIPRVEVTALGDVVKKAAAEIDPEVELIIGGSYRRGSESSGDIDFIVTKSNTKCSSEILPFLHRLVCLLTNSGFLVCELQVPRSGSGTKWHGCCVLPAPSPSSAEEAIENNEKERPWRRIDFLVVPAAELGAALIYFTGNDIFNRSLRLLASRKGMRLNQRGLYKDVMRGPGRVKVTEGELVEGRSETEIFKLLEVPWREPHERIC